MNLDTLVQQWPNGLHDAFLERLSIDYLNRTATLGLNIWIGDMSAERGPERERYQRADILISDLLWCVVEPPNEPSTRRRTEGLWIDAGSVAGLKSMPTLPPKPDSAFCWWFFVRDWNSFIYIAGGDAATLD